MVATRHHDGPEAVSPSDAQITLSLGRIESYHSHPWLSMSMSMSVSIYGSTPRPNARTTRWWTSA